DPAELGDAGDVGHDVEPAVGLDDAGEGRLDRRPVGDVAGHHLDAVGPLAPQVEPDDGGALVAEPLGHGTADARGAPGDEGDPARPRPGPPAVVAHGRSLPPGPGRSVPARTVPLVPV